MSAHRYSGKFLVLFILRFKLLFPSDCEIDCFLRPIREEKSLNKRSTGTDLIFVITNIELHSVFIRIMYIHLSLNIHNLFILGVSKSILRIILFIQILMVFVLLPLSYDKIWISGKYDPQYSYRVNVFEIGCASYYPKHDWFIIM